MNLHHVVKNKSQIVTNYILCSVEDKDYDIADSFHVILIKFSPLRIL